MKAHIGPLVSWCVYDKRQKVTYHMDGNIPYTFEYWVGPVVHLLLLLLSTPGLHIPLLTEASVASKKTLIRSWMFLWLLSFSDFLDTAAADKLIIPPQSLSLSLYYTRRWCIDHLIRKLKGRKIVDHLRQMVLFCFSLTWRKISKCLWQWTVQRSTL